jgi:predicted nuclease of predicted toxin-antitoxin system
MSYPLLLDEMFSDAIAQRLRARGHDVISVVAHAALVALPDDQIFAYAAAEGRALVTANIKDFMPLDGQYRAAGRDHPGLILVSTKTFPQNRVFATAVTAALEALLDDADKVQPGQVLFLTRGQAGRARISR